jgi:hypothetical protein
MSIQHHGEQRKNSNSRRNFKEDGDDGGRKEAWKIPTHAHSRRSWVHVNPLLQRYFLPWMDNSVHETRPKLEQKPQLRDLSLGTMHMLHGTA